jgi:hypothetical protein
MQPVTAADIEQLAGNPAGLLGGQEYEGIGNVFPCPHQDTISKCPDEPMTRIAR